MSKARIYLDTNTVFDFFINEAKAIRSGDTSKIPSKFRFMLESKGKIEFVTSFLTKAEVSRELILVSPKVKISG